jgi:hypothetical protein
MLLAAVQLLCLGVLGAYVGRIHEEVQRRPMDLVDHGRNAACVAADQETARGRR